MKKTKLSLIACAAILIAGTLDNAGAFDFGDLLKPRVPGTNIPGTKIPIPPILKPPQPPSTLDDLNPICVSMLKTHRPSFFEGICGSGGTNIVIPQLIHYGDKRVDIQEQCR